MEACEKIFLIKNLHDTNERRTPGGRRGKLRGGMGRLRFAGAFFPTLNERTDWTRGPGGVEAWGKGKEGAGVSEPAGRESSHGFFCTPSPVRRAGPRREEARKKRRGGNGRWRAACSEEDKAARRAGRSCGRSEIPRIFAACAGKAPLAVGSSPLLRGDSTFRPDSGMVRAKEMP